MQFIKNTIWIKFHLTAIQSAHTKKTTQCNQSAYQKGTFGHMLQTQCTFNFHNVTAHSIT